MKKPCTHIESELLLHGLGELPYWASWRLSRHLHGCEECRRHQADLLAISGIVAKTLTPPGGTSRNRRAPVSVGQGWLMFACLMMLITGGLLITRVAYVRYNAVIDRSMSSDRPCSPGLPSDKCR